MHEPEVQQQVHEQLLTTEELFRTMDQRPKKDKLGGLWKMSSRYKAVQKSLEKVNEVVEGVSPTDLADNEKKRKELRKKLKKLVKEAKEYLKQHTGKGESQKKKATAMQALLQRSQLALDVIHDPDLALLPDTVTLGQAIQIKRCGVLFKDMDFDNYSDDDIDEDASEDNFGSGNANTVSKLVYGEGEHQRTLIYKPEPEVDRNPLLAQKTLGIDLEDPRYGERNIASRALDKLLGGNTVVESRMVLHNGELGLLMDKADGRMPGERAKVDVTQQQQQGFIDGVLQNNQPRDKAVRMLKAMEFVEVDVGNDQTQWKKIEPYYADPFKGDKPDDTLKASIQQQLCGLEWADALTGQSDRHGENYLISFDRDSGTCSVTGIDNDLAFGQNSKDIPEPGPDPLTGYNGVGLPQLIDRVTYDRITALDWKRDVLPTLAGRLKDPEIKATKSRFEKLQAHARKLGKNGFVVDNWKTWRSPDNQTVTELLTSETSGSSYYKRDIHEHTTEDDQDQE